MSLFTISHAEGVKCRFAEHIRDLVPDMKHGMALANVVEKVDPLGLSILFNMTLSSFRDSIKTRSIPLTLKIASPELAHLLQETLERDGGKLFDYIHYFMILEENLNTESEEQDVGIRDTEHRSASQPGGEAEGGGGSGEDGQGQQASV